MTPIKFPEVNVVYAKDQPEYIPLPSHHDANGVVTTCWKMTWKERFIVFCTGKVWLQLLTFNKSIQPQKITIKKPI